MPTAPTNIDSSNNKDNPHFSMGRQTTDKFDTGISDANKTNGNLHTMTSSGLSGVATAASNGAKRQDQKSQGGMKDQAMAKQNTENGGDLIIDKPQKSGAKPGNKASKESGSTSFASKARKDGTEKKKEKDKKEEKEEENTEPWWPAFNFDGRNALKSKLLLNLRNCQYDLFRDIAMQEMGWKIVDYRNRVIEYIGHGNSPNKNKQSKGETEDRENGEDDQNSDKDSNADSNDEGSQKEQKPQDAGIRPDKDWGPQYKIRPDLDADNWDIYWADSGMTPEFLSSLAPCQKVNHFLGMYNICRKSTLGMHLKRFQKEFPDHYNFFPPTWIYPAEFHDIQEYTKKKYDKRKEKIEDGLIRESEAENEPVVLFICKPESGSQGRGIFIAQKVEEMRLILNKNQEKERERMNEYLKVEQGIEILQTYSNQTYQKRKEEIIARQIEKPQNQYIVQKYVKKPALYKGHKYDFRIYVLITSVISPMNIYLYNDGLVRLASQKYEHNKNFDNAFTHLTNYSLNKNNKEFDASQHKLRLKDVLKGQMVSECNGKVFRKNANTIWSEIEQIVIKTMYVVQPQLAHLYRTSQAKEPDLCCDLLGFDVMLDYKLKPWMLEVNHMPSFRADTEIDHNIKHDLILNTLQILQLSIESRRQLEVILKQEKNLANQYGHLRRMTVKEHSERVRFDHNLIDKYLPKCNFKRIYPVDPGSGGVAANGDVLEDLYVKIEKSAQTVWKKQVGMIQKKDENANIHEKPKKKKKYKKNALTSMTSHVKDGKKKIDAGDDDIDDNDQEEDPEDGIDGDNDLADIEEEEGNKDIDDDEIRKSTMSFQKENNENGGSDLKHIVSNSGSNRRNIQGIAAYNRQNPQNQSQSSLSQNKQQKPGIPGQRPNGQQFSIFNPVSNLTNQNVNPDLCFVEQANQNGDSYPINQYNNHNREILQANQKRNEQMANKQIRDELNNMPRQVQVPTLNEILTQLHQDPGFRQRYKEYCRAVLDGRFSFGGIKNPIYDHIYGSHGIMQLSQNRGADQMGHGPPGHGHMPQGAPGGQPHQMAGGVTLLSNNARHQSQVKYQQQQQRDKRGKLETIPHGQQAPANPGTSGGPTISEAAYFIQRVNRILQNQGDATQTAPAPAAPGAYSNHCQAPNPSLVASTYSFNFIGNHNGGAQAQAAQVAAAQHQAQQSSHSQMNKYNLLMNQPSNNATPNPYLGLAIQSVSASPNYAPPGEKSATQPANGAASANSSAQVGTHQVASYANAIKQMQLQNQQIAIALGQQASSQNKVLFNQKPPGAVHPQNPMLTQPRTSMNTTGTNVNINQKVIKKHSIVTNAQNTQKAINKIQSLQNNVTTQRQSMLAAGRDSQSGAEFDPKSQAAHQSMQKTVTKLITQTVTQHPGQSMPNKKLQQQMMNQQPQTAQAQQQGVPMSFQQQQLITNLALNKNGSKNAQQFSNRGAFNVSGAAAPDGGAAGEEAENAGASEPGNNVVVSTQLYKKQAASFHNANLQSTNQIKLSNLSASQTPPFNSKHKQYDSVKRYMQVGKGIGGPGPFDIEAGGADQSTSHNRQKMLDARRAAEENGGPDGGVVSSTYGLNSAGNPHASGVSPTVGQKFSLISNSAKIKQSGPIKAINMSVNNHGISVGGVDSGVVIGTDHGNADKLLSQSIKIHNENSRQTKQNLSANFQQMVKLGKDGGQDFPNIQERHQPAQAPPSSSGNKGSRGSVKRPTKIVNGHQVPNEQSYRR